MDSPRTGLRRRDFLKTGGSLAVAAGFSPRSIGAAAPSAGRAVTPFLPELERFNYVIGTQAIGATYQFTQESVLVEAARAILEMGSNVIKFTMGRGYERMMIRPSKAAYPETMQYLLNQGSDAKETPRIKFPGASIAAPPADPRIHTLTDLASLEPSFAQVFRMPFAYYLIWTYAFTPGWWHEGFSTANQDREYDEIRTFASYLLRTFSGSGKTFFIGHWEGDWHLRPDLKTDSDLGVTAAAIGGMADWLNVRQRAIDDAKRNSPHHDVHIYHYAEVNHVTAVSMAGRPSVCNSVIPRTNVDYVSYSTYDSLRDVQKQLPEALNYIETKLPVKPQIVGKRVFIGEYGFPAWKWSEADRVRKSHEIMRIGLSWGCPFVLCWQLYNNEVSEGRENGYWLIDDKGLRKPLWHAHHDFYQRARKFVVEYHRKEGRLPDMARFRRVALEFLEDPPARTQAS